MTINRDFFEDLFVLEMANNHWGRVERGKKIVDDFAHVVRYNGVRASIKLQLRDVDSFIHKDHVAEGVLGAINLPAELIDPVYNNIQNMMVKGFVYKKPIFDPQRPDRQESVEFIPLDENQIIYVNSGVMNETKNMVLPFLENARRAYRQLSLIEDAIVIYRLVRAPERLVFNVDVGNMSTPKAEAYIKKLISNYWSSKTFDIDHIKRVLVSSTYANDKKWCDKFNFFLTI